MRTLLHLSDLHFGRVEPATLDPLIEAAKASSADLIVVSGDLTQRARTREFLAARAFLDRLPGPVLVVPGNHDIPMRNPLARFATPLARYRRLISTDTEPVHRDAEMVVVGVNSARSLTIKNGRVNDEQAARIRELMCGLPEGVLKVIACHHPFDLPEACATERVVGGACGAIAALAGCGVDLILSGHYHRTHAVRSTHRYTTPHRALLLVAAGTATSTRTRGQANAFNLIRSHAARLEIVRYEWTAAAGSFLPASPEVFSLGPSGWLEPATERLHTS